MGQRCGSQHQRAVVRLPNVALAFVRNGLVGFVLDQRQVEAGGIVQKRQVMPTRSYLSQAELPVTFGLGGVETIDRVTIHWPDGSEQDASDVKVDQLNIIEQAP